MFKCTLPVQLFAGVETSHEYALLLYCSYSIDVRETAGTVIAFHAFFVWFPLSGNLAWGLPLYYEPRGTLGWGFFSSGPQARRIWYLLKIESNIFLPVMTSLPQVIPVRRTTHSHLIWNTSSACLHDLLFEFEGSQNCGLSVPKMCKSGLH